MPTIWPLDPLERPESRAALEAAGWTIDPDAHCHALYVRLSRVSKPMLTFLPDLRYVVTQTTGLDHIDLAECERRGIKVVSLNGHPRLSDVRATAELTVGLILALTRRIPWAAQHVRAGGWERYPFEGMDLAGKLVGIVGCGRIGKIVRRTLIMGFDCLTWDHDDLRDRNRPVWMERLGKCDIITVHATLNDSTRGMFGPTEFAAMKPGALFINTARGGIVDTDALLDSLESGHLGGAALDVVAGEPDIPPRLVKAANEMPNLIVTPHIGGCTREALAATEAMVIEAFLGAVADG